MSKSIAESVAIATRWALALCCSLAGAYFTAGTIIQLFGSHLLGFSIVLFVVAVVSFYAAFLIAAGDRTGCGSRAFPAGYVTVELLYLCFFTFLFSGTLKEVYYQFHSLLLYFDAHNSSRAHLYISLSSLVLLLSIAAGLAAVYREWRIPTRNKRSVLLGWLLLLLGAYSVAQFIVHEVFWPMTSDLGPFSGEHGIFGNYYSSILVLPICLFVVALSLRRLSEAMDGVAPLFRGRRDDRKPLPSAGEQV